jgi:hypothetical protein
MKGPSQKIVINFGTGSAEGHNYRSIDSFRRSGAMKTYSQMIKTDFVRHSGGSKKNRQSFNNQNFFQAVKVLSSVNSAASEAAAGGEMSFGSRYRRRSQ